MSAEKHNSSWADFRAPESIRDVSCISQEMQNTAQNSPRFTVSNKACMTREHFGADL